MFAYNSNNDSDSIDFEFFETEGGQIKTYSNNQNCSSKIITQAVIETNPLSSLDLFKSTSKPKNTSNEVKDLENVKNVERISIDLLSTPTSFVERNINSTKTEEPSLNIKSYQDGYEYEDSDSNLSFSEDSDSDNSLISETTVETSEFTSVSPLSFTSDSNLQPDEFVGSSKLKDTTEESLDDVPAINDQAQKHDFDIQRSSNSEELSKNVELNMHLEDNSDMGMNYANDFEEEIENNNSANNDYKESDVSVLGEEFEDISLSQKSSSTSSAKVAQSRSSSKLRFRKREPNLTFTREEQIKIERDNMILLKKIMSQAKPRVVSLNHSFCHKRTSAAINRAKQQKKIEHDNYILYTKISALARTKKVC